MAILSGALTLRRYRVAGQVPDEFRTLYADALQDHAWKEPREWAKGIEAVGWCQVHNLLDVDFGDLNRWMYNEYIVVAMRVDKKSLPAKYFKAHLDKKIQAWCQEHGRPKCPTGVKADIKEQLETEMMARTLPRVATHEMCWNVVEGQVLFHNCSEGANDAFRKLFRHTFGLNLLPWSPLDFLAARPELAQVLEVQGLSDLRAAPYSDGGDR